MRHHARVETGQNDAQNFCAIDHSASWAIYCGNAFCRRILRRTHDRGGGGQPLIARPVVEDSQRDAMFYS
ncbi:MAG: hypothetical protein ACK55Z_37895, partial [bacterium]